MPQPSVKEIKDELDLHSDINEGANLGCRVKFPIEHVLAGLETLQKQYANLQFSPREDAYIFDTDGNPVIHRFDRSLEYMANGGDGDLAGFIAGINPSGLVSLMALSDGSSKVFIDKVRAFYDTLEHSEKPLVLGKGHTIRTGKNEAEFGVLDFVETKPGLSYGVANNDTIVDIDCKLPHSSWITVFTAINNALNDLFASGVYENIRIFPTIAGRTPEETKALEESVQKYAQKYADIFSEHGWRFEPAAPLGQSNGGYNTKVVGATVVGVTDREVPRNEYLREGQLLFATRPIGDLIPLAEYMALAYEVGFYQQNGKPQDAAKLERLSQLESLRLKILQYLVTPNIEAAKIIAQYLPKKGDPFEDSEHITSSIDVSGPGIQTVAWLAQDSGHDVYLDGVVYHDPSIPSSPIRADQTSGTNGAIILAAQPDVAYKVMDDLKSAGYEPWVVGRVGKKTAQPTIHITDDESLPNHALSDLRGYFGDFAFQ